MSYAAIALLGLLLGSMVGWSIGMHNGYLDGIKDTIPMGERTLYLGAGTFRFRDLPANVRIVGAGKDRTFIVDER